MADRIQPQEFGADIKAATGELLQKQKAQEQLRSLTTVFTDMAKRAIEQQRVGVETGFKEREIGLRERAVAREKAPPTPKTLTPANIQTQQRFTVNLFAKLVGAKYDQMGNFLGWTFQKLDPKALKLARGIYEQNAPTLESMFGREPIEYLLELKEPTEKYQKPDSVPQEIWDRTSEQQKKEFTEALGK